MMRFSPLSLFAATVLSTLAACTLNSAGLGSDDPGRVAVVASGAGAAGDSGASAGGAVGTSITGENTPTGAGIASGLGGAGGGDAAGVIGTEGSGGALAGSGAAGDERAGSGGTGPTGSGQAGSDGPPDVDGAADASTGLPDAPSISPLGCADGTREGFKSVDKYPNLCGVRGVAGKFPASVSAETMTLSATGARATTAPISPAWPALRWPISAPRAGTSASRRARFSTNTQDCKDALTPSAQPMFFATRQRGPMLTCDPMNQTGTNNIYGCGNFGTPVMAACTPFTRMLRDADCRANPPWMCALTARSARASASWST